MLFGIIADLRSKFGNIVDADDVLEHFIPVTVEKIVNDLRHSKQWQNGQAEQFEQICEILIALYHAKFHKDLLDIKHHYRPFSPDRDTLLLENYSSREIDQRLKSFLHVTRQLLARANFVELPLRELNAVLKRKSPQGVEVKIDLDAFDIVALFYRGVASRKVSLRSWRTGFRKIKQVCPIYRRLFVIIKPKLEHQPNDENSGGQNVYLKIFKDIPQDDLEMLFPNVKIRMTLFDKVKFSITGGGGTVGGIMGLATKIGTTLNPYTLAVALVGFAGVIWRQIANVLSQRNRYMAQLARHLYFYNLNNNMGSISQLLDMAEMEECKEAILAYYFLTVSDQPLSQAALDKRVETHIHNRYGIKVDYDVSDGIGKLRASALLIENDALLQVRPLPSALRKLHGEWNDIYQLPNELN